MRLPKQLETLDLWKLCIVFGVLAMLPYLGALQAGYLFDDDNAVLSNPLVTGDFDIVAIFQRDFWGRAAGESVGSYRPLVVLSFCFDQAVGGGAPWAFHASSILFHALASAALFAYLDRRFGRSLAATATLLFCVHALHTENVASIVGRADVLATTLVLLTLALARQGGRRSWLAGLAFFAALLAKEIAVAAIAVLLADLVLGLDPNAPGKRRAKLIALGSVLAAFAVYMVVRIAALGMVEPPVLIQGNPLVDASFAERVYTSAALFSRTLGQLLLPWNLIVDYSIPAIMPESTWLTLDVIFGFLLVLGMAAAMWLLRKSHPTLVWGLAIIFASYVPVSNLITLVPAIYAERLLYLPSVGYCVVAAYLLRLAYERKRYARVVTVVFYIYIAFNAGRSAVRTIDWQSQRSIFESAVATEPVSLLSTANLAAVERADGNLEIALYYYEKGTRLAPTIGNAYTEVGVTLDLMNAPERAHPWFHRALQVTPNCAECVDGAVSFYLKYGRFAAAESAINNLERTAPEKAATVLELRARLEAIRSRYGSP